MGGESAATISAGELAEMVGGELTGDAKQPVGGVSSIEGAGALDITFITGRKFVASLAASPARTVLAGRALDLGDAGAGRTIIRVDDPEWSIITVLEHFDRGRDLPPRGVHATAWVDPTATLGVGVRIGPHASVGANSVLGDRCVLHAGARVADSCRLGPDCELRANAVVESRCVLGARVLLHPSSVIGADGFNYRPAPDGSGLAKIPHLSHVELHDDVEIGAASCVDRGKFEPTVVGAGTKIDNLCQIAHNVVVGRSTVMASGVGVSGSVRVGDGVQIAGQAGVADHVTIHDGAKIGGGSAVVTDIPARKRVLGYPARDAGVELRAWSERLTIASQKKGDRPGSDGPG